MGIGSEEVIALRGPVLFDMTGTEILTLDASITQEHGLSCEVTDHPVESGANVSDHVRINPIALRITGVVSAYPFADDTAPVGREVDAWGKLESMVGQVFEVSTTLRRYPKMVLLRVDVTRERGVTDLEPKLELREIRTVSQQSVTLPPDQIRKKPQKASGQGKADSGRTSGSAADAAQAAATRRSMAAALLDAVLKSSTP